uniref:Putative LAGLIDADG homing endonuclease n=1 Tax=Lobochlamys segnis TaxID=52035 RepID=Q39559_9CHLO|nr:site-specific DNA endonuclease I-CpaII [Lobochlamys segnis]ALO21061.1 putative LAGLIDADG homing endonuclease [Lobochlamys segnis]
MTDSKSRNNNNFLSNNLLPLTDDEKALIAGTLLGDAHIQKRGDSYRLKIAHGLDHEELVVWKYNRLIRLCQTTQPPRVETYSTKLKSGVLPQGVVFYTSSGKYLKETYDLFYKQTADGRRVKTITQELIDSLPKHPLVLAAFFMDDGSVRSDCYSGKIATPGFAGKEESQLLCNYLHSWDVQANVVAHKKANNQYYIGLPAKTFGRFINIIEPYVREVPALCYKLNESRKPRND